MIGASIVRFAIQAVVYFAYLGWLYRRGIKANRVRFWAEYVAVAVTTIILTYQLIPG